MTPQEFSAKIKEKNPSLQTVDDVELAKKVISANPNLRSMVDFGKETYKPKPVSEIEPRNVEEIKDTGFLGKVKEFGTGILREAAQIGADVTSLSKLAPYQPEWAKKANEKITGTLEDLAKPKTPTEQAGKTTAQIGEFFIPSSLVLKGTKALKATKLASEISKVPLVGKVAETALTRGLPEAISAGAVSAYQTKGDVGEIKSNAILAGAIPTTFKGLSVLTPKLSSIKSVATGVPGEVFERIKKMPEAYDNALNYISENAEQPFFGLSNKIGNKLREIKNTAKNEFDAAINTVKTNFPDTTFNLENKIPDLNKTLSRFNLTIKPVRVGGKITGESYVTPTTRTSPFTDKDVAQIDNLYKKMRMKDMTVDELLDFQESAKSFLESAAKADNKKMMALGYSLVDDSMKFIDAVLPEVKGANAKYRAYYKAIESGGNKIVNKSGEQIKEAEQFLSNLANLNKGEQRKAIKALEEITGVPILDNVQILKDAQKLNQLFPATGSRTQDILRSFLVKAAATGGTGASLFTGNIPGLIGSAGLTAISSPKLQAKASIKAAQLGKKLKPKVPQVLKTLTERVTGK